MHIPDAVLSPPVALATGCVGVCGFAYSLRRVERESGDRTVVLMGMMSAFLFAAQMVKFPVFPGVAGHLLGGVLAGVLLGPWAGTAVIGVVLLVQCLLFGDGGVTALGANFFNMGIVGALGGYAIYDPIRRAIGGRNGVLIGAMVAAWISVILGAGAFAIELSLGGTGAFFTVLGWMTLIHAGIGVGEAIITGLVVRFLLVTRPDLIYGSDKSASPATRWGQVAIAGLAASLAVAVFAAPFASEWPDGLEHVGAKLGFLKEDVAPIVRGIWPEYQAGFFGSRSIRVATAAAGMIGTLAVFGTALLMARTLARRKPGEIGPDAA